MKYVLLLLISFSAFAHPEKLSEKREIKKKASDSFLVHTLLAIVSARAAYLLDNQRQQGEQLLWVTLSGLSALIAVANLKVFENNR